MAMTQPAKSRAMGRPFLGVQFAACRVYSRVYRNPQGTAYVAVCPRCGRTVRIPVGTHGTTQRFFVVDCRL
jgi:ribosomal protein S27E